MGTIHEFCAEFHISLKKATRMDKGGWLRLDKNAKPVDEIRLTLRRGARLTTAQLVQLIDNPDWISDLGNWQRQAEEQLAVLGDAKAQAAPADVTAYILDAYRNEPEAVTVVAAWVRTILPEQPVGHAYIATRLLLGVPLKMREHDIPRLQRVLMNCRYSPILAGCWSRVKQTSRIVTLYKKPTLDL